MQDIDYADLVRKIRAALGVTQEELAHEVDVTVGTLNNWENRRHRPLKAQRKRLDSLAASLGVAPATFSVSAASRRTTAGREKTSRKRYV